ncbi:hypothetical protein Sjap_010300 [Stephania japonica]|uniref:Uncharacterized protein n=1 Tax=Stephania japonica TaxID=461633 RepID=A0AAP0JBC6_9MAGN
MEVHRVLHMNGGEGEASYASNSSFQRAVITMLKPILEETILDLISNGVFLEFEVLHIADLGCSSGPNTLSVISHMVDAVTMACQLLHCQPPEFQVFLNDLPGNDFDIIFKSLPSFYDELKRGNSNNGPCYIAGMVGSFYERLFPRKTIHLIHSSYSLHYLSQGLIEEAQIDSFNLPYYAPSVAEVRHIILEEGSFSLIRLEAFEISWDANTVNENDVSSLDNLRRAKYVTKCIRAVAEPMLTSHFGGSQTMDALFQRHTERIAELYSKEEPKYYSLVIILTKK